jgi:KaiC/GvpD/RAD55 family RecA-like ATPase
MAPSHATVGQAFEVRVDLVNVSRRCAFLANIQDLLPKEFQVTASQPEVLRDGSSIQLKENKLEPFAVKTIKLTLQATKAGTFGLNPKVVYVDDLGQSRTCTARVITLTVELAQPAYEVLPGRVASGTMELDKLLLGGIPEKYAVVLASPSSDEREMLINRFLEEGAEAGETVLYITCEAGKTLDLAKKFRNFHLLVSNLQADLVMQDLPNVFKLKGIENLTDIDISLAKLFRTLDPQQTVPNRACITLLSDVLLQHHAVIARKWLSSLLSNLNAKGFTTLAVFDPQMHPPEETQAVLGVFDGEIRVTERETSKGTEQVLKIRKLVNQKYQEDEVVLVKEKLST